MITLPLDQLHSILPADGWRRLETYLGNVRVGFNESIETPFFRGDPKDPKAFGTWYYENIAKSNIPELNELEREEINTFTPMSIRKPWEMREASVKEYFNIKDFPTNHSLERSFDKVQRFIKAHSLVPSSFRSSYRAMPKDSNLGLPWFTRDKELAESYLTRANNIQSGGWREDILPAVVGWRGQSSDDPNFPKQRVVWMMDHVETIIGLSVQVPVLDKLRKLSNFAAWGTLEGVDRMVTQLLDRTRKQIMSADFHGFDKRFPRVVIHSAFDLLRRWFVESAKPLIDWLELQFLTVGIATPNGIYSGRNAGVPSGSALTNLIDSLGQLLMLPSMYWGSVLGDDGIYEGVPDPDELASMFKSNYGMEVSTDKGGFSNDQVRFLQRLHLRSYRVHGICVGVRSLVRTWKGACYLERHTPDLPEEFFSARTISQLENAKWHPNFRKAVEYFYSVDRVLQHLDPVEIFRKAGGTGFVEKTLGLDSYKFGSELPSVGLSTFKTVSELRR